MKRFSIKANLLSGLTHTLTQLKPEQIGSGVADVVGENRTAIKAIYDCEKANATFMDAVKITEEAKLACHKRLTEEYNAEKTGKEPEDSALLAAKNVLFKKEVAEIQEKSTANADEVVSVELSDEKFVCVKRLFPMTVSQWEKSELFVDIADALDAAVEA